MTWCPQRPSHTASAEHLHTAAAYSTYSQIEMPNPTAISVSPTNAHPSVKVTICSQDAARVPGGHQALQQVGRGAGPRGSLSRSCSCPVC